MHENALWKITKFCAYFRSLPVHYEYALNYGLNMVWRNNKSGCFISASLVFWLFFVCLHTTILLHFELTIVPSALNATDARAPKFDCFDTWNETFVCDNGNSHPDHSNCLTFVGSEHFQSIHHFFGILSANCTFWSNK